MSERNWWIGGGSMLAVLAIAAGIWTLTGARATSSVSAAKSADPAASAPPLEFRPTEVIRLRAVAMPERIEFSGALVAPDSAIVRAKAAGTLLALNVAEGSRVQAGQTLGRIDVADLATRVAERRANVESARAALDQAERTHESNKRLAAQNFISSIALDNSQAGLDTARAQLAQARASLDQTEVGMREAALVAPIAGIVARRFVVAGEKVSVEQQLLSIVDIRRLELAGTVGTHEVSKLAAGMSVSLQVEGLAEPVQGQLARIAPAAEAGTRAIGVAVAVANPGEKLRAGQYAIARVEIADPRPRASLPQTALSSDAGQDQVWVIADGRLMRRAVTLGRRDEAQGLIEVLGGLAADAQVLAQRYDNLREGAKALVSVRAGAASAAASLADAR